MSRRVGFGVFVGLGLATAALLVVVVAPRSSGEPDGLERVAIDEGFSTAASDHALDGSPTAGYTVDGRESAWGSVAAGLLGVAVTFAVAGGLLLAVRRRTPRQPADADAGADARADADTYVRADARAPTDADADVRVDGSRASPG